MTRSYPPLKPLTPGRAEALLADPARQRVVDLMLSAETLEEIEAAFEAQHAWLVATPDDSGVLEAGEVLSAIRESLLEAPTSASTSRDPA